MPPRRVEGGTLVFDVDDVGVQLPGEISLCVDGQADEKGAVLPTR